MPILQNSTLLQSLTLQHGKPQALPALVRPASSAAQTLQSKASISRLLHLARHPIEDLNEAFEDWYDGTTKEERTQRQSLEDRKQLLYLKLREVMRLVQSFEGEEANANAWSLVHQLQ